MIAGIAHLTLEAGLSQGIALGAGMGFTLEFADEVALPAGFEGVEDRDHRLPLALLANADGIRLEIVEHGQRSGHRGAYAGLFRCPPPSTADPVPTPPDLRAAVRRTDALRDPTCALLAPPDGMAWFDSSPAAGGLAGVLCTVRDVHAEVAFWSEFARLTWQPVAPEVTWASISSPWQRTRCEFVIAAGDRLPPVHAMNDSGFPSIGVTSTSIERDCQRAEAAGGVLRAAPIVTSVGGRRLRMALVETPGGAPVELLSAHRPRG